MGKLMVKESEFSRFINNKIKDSIGNDKSPIGDNIISSNESLKISNRVVMDYFVKSTTEFDIYII